MKLWISSETQSDVFDCFRIASIKVEDCINDAISSNDYNIPLDGLDCIAILRDDDNFEEVIKYSPKKKDMDFRLKVDYQSFKNGSDFDREKAVFKMLLRSLMLLEKKGITGDGMEQLKSDVNAVGIDKAWL